MKFTAKELTALLTSDELLIELSRQSQITLETFDETEVVAHLDPLNGIYYVPPGKKGTYFGMKSASDELDDPLDKILVLYCHLHPEVTGPAVPSEGDLNVILYREQGVIANGRVLDVCLRIIRGVGKVRSNGDIEALIYQEKDRLSESDISDADEGIVEFLASRGVSPIEASIMHSSITSQEIAQVLKKFGYNSCVLHYPSNISTQKGRDRFRVRSTAKIRRVLKPFGQEISVTEQSANDRTETYRD